MEDFNLSETIVDFLSSNDEKLYSMSALHTSLISKYPFLDIKESHKRSEFNEKFKLEFLTIDSKYKGIYRFIISDRQYIVWSLRTYEELYKIFVDKTFDSDNRLKTSTKETLVDTHTINTEIETTNYYELVKSYILNKDYKYIYQDIKIDGVNNITHLLVQNNDLTSLKQLNELHKIDWSLKNKHGKTCVELAKENKYCDILEFILNEIFESTVFSYKNLLENQKTLQKDSYQKNSELTIENKRLMNECLELEQKNLNKSRNSWLFNYSLVLLGILYVYRLLILQ
jgi:hypothetical protein